MTYRICGMLLVLLATGCGPTSKQQEPAVVESQTTGVNSEEIVLGSHTDLSGPLALHGVGAINGARMRFDEANKAGGINGRHIRLVVEDNKSEVSRAVTAVRRLLDQEHIFAMVFAMGDATNDAAMAELQKDGVPNLFPFSSAVDLANSKRPVDFTDRPTRDDEMRAAVSYFVGQQHKTRPCVVYEDVGAGKEVQDAVAGALAKADVKPAAAVAFKSDQSDFSQVIKHIQDSKCDVVFLGAEQGDAAAILQAAHKQQITASFVGDDSEYGESFTGLDDNAGEGYYAVTQMAKLYPKDELPPKVRAWWNNYVELYGDQPRVPAMEGYRAADLVVRGLQAAGSSPTRASLAKAIEGITDYTDVFGYHLSFGPNKHNGTSSCVLSVVEKGRWKVVERAISGA